MNPVTHRPRRTRRERLEAIARRNGVRIEPYGDHGAVRVVGRGLYLLAAEIRFLSELDLDPQWQSADTPLHA